MESFRVKHRASVEKDIRNIPKDFTDAIAIRINSLVHDPLPVGCKKLAKEDLYRIRVGDYRIVYSVDTRSKIVTIERINHRKNVYRKFWRRY